MFAIVIAVIVGIILSLIFIPCSWRKETLKEKYQRITAKEINNLARIEMKRYLNEHEKIKNERK